MAKKKTRQKKDKEEVSEIFEVEKAGKKKIIETHSTEDKKHATKKQIKEQNTILRNVIIVSVFIILAFVITNSYLNSVKKFEYEGVNYEKIIEGNLILYKTSLPVIYNGEIVPYNFYLRNDPKNLENIPFVGELKIMENMVINITEDSECNNDREIKGKGIIAVANLVNLYKILGTKVIKDPNASCDTLGRYMFVQIEPGEETSIKQFGPSCYKLTVNNCETLKVTEKLMIKTFTRINEEL